MRTISLLLVTLVATIAPPAHAALCLDSPIGESCVPDFVNHEVSGGVCVPPSVAATGCLVGATAETALTVPDESNPGANRSVGAACVASPDRIDNVGQKIETYATATAHGAPPAIATSVYCHLFIDGVPVKTVSDTAAGPAVTASSVGWLPPRLGAVSVCLSANATWADNSTAQFPTTC